MSMNQKGFVNIILIGLIVVLVGGAIGYFAYFNKSDTPQSSAPPPFSSPNTTPSSPTASQSPSISVLTPNGGETLVEGKTYIISWKSSNVPSDTKVVIGIEGKDTKGLRFTLPLLKEGDSFLSANGEFKWVARTPGEYQIVAWLLSPSKSKFTHYSPCNGLLCPGDWVARDTSDTIFQLVPPQGVQYSLKVTSPNSNESIEGGTSFSIKWSSSGLDSKAAIRIGYRPYKDDQALTPTTGGSEVSSDLIAKVSNSGSYAWNTPDYVRAIDLPGNYPQCASGARVSWKYYIEVNWIDEMGNYRLSDFSDQPFILSGKCSISPE